MSQLINKRFANQPMIGINRIKWRDEANHPILHDEKYKELRATIFERDNYTCTFCGFKTTKYQEIYHANGDHDANEADNLLTCCSLCHRTSHLFWCASSGSAFIAAIPELSQTEINHVVRIAHLITATHNPVNPNDVEAKNAATSLFASFQSRGNDAIKQLYGIDISNPYELSRVLAKISLELYDKRSTLFSSLRVVYTPSFFSQDEITYYALQKGGIFRPAELMAALVEFRS